MHSAILSFIDHLQTQLTGWQIWSTTLKLIE